MNSLDKMEDYDRLRQERDELEAQVRSLQLGYDSSTERILELSARDKVLRDALRLIAYSYTTIFNCSLEAKEALSITTSEALARHDAEIEKPDEWHLNRFQYVYSPAEGYVVSRVLYKPEHPQPLVVCVDKIAVFVYESEAMVFCKFRNSCLLKYNTDAAEVIE